MIGFQKLPHQSQLFIDRFASVLIAIDRMAEQRQRPKSVNIRAQAGVNHQRALRGIIGGSALSKGLARLALDLGIDVFSAYGMSETCPLLTAAHLSTSMLEGDPDEQVRMRCKTGRAAPLVTTSATYRQAERRRSCIVLDWMLERREPERRGAGLYLLRRAARTSSRRSFSASSNRRVK